MAESKFTEERVNKLLRALECGTPIGVACRWAGIHRSTLRNWRVKGRNAAEGEPFHAFEEQVVEALANPFVLACEAIHRRAERWQASAWLLERRLPHQFGRLHPDMTDKRAGAPDQNALDPLRTLELIIEDLDDDARDKVLDAYRRRAHELTKGRGKHA